MSVRRRFLDEDLNAQLLPRRGHSAIHPLEFRAFDKTGFGIANGGWGRAAKLRFVSDRNYFPNDRSPTIKQMMSITEHRMMSNVLGGLQFGYTNAWTQHPDSISPSTFPATAEVNNTQSTTIRLGLEYPAGVFTEMKYGGAGSGTILAGNTLFCDESPVIPPKGALYRLHVYMTGAAGGICFHNVGWYLGGNFSIANDSTHSSATTTTDYHMGGDPSPSPSSSFIPATAIIGITPDPCVAIIGDSLGLGLTQAASAANYHGAVGMIGMALARAGIAHANYACSGECGSVFVNNGSKRAALINAYADRVIGNYAGNDYDAGLNSASALLSMVQNVGAMFTIPKMWTPVGPYATSGTSNWTTEATQTVGDPTWQGIRSTYNASIRAGIPNFLPCFDTISVIESASSPGKFRANTPAFANDSVHVSVTGALAVANADILPISYLV